MANRQLTVKAARLSGVGRGRKPVTIALAVDANQWIRDEALKRGWQLIHLHYCEWQLPPGIVPQGALVNLLPGDPHLETLRQMDCKVVRLGMFAHPGDATVPAVLPDYVAAARLAAAHFAERGFEHVGYAGSNPWSEARVLHDAFAAATQELGMTLHLHRFHPASGESHGPKLIRMEQEFVAWLRKTPKPLGLLAPGDWMAARFCNWAMRAGIRIPEELAVLGRGNRDDICESFIPTISAFDLDEEGGVRSACELLARLMAGEAAPAKAVHIPPRGLVERESTHVLATPDPVVAAALRFMWDRLDRDLPVTDVAGAVGISGRQLERLFRKALGRTVNEEMRRKRMEEGKRLLRTTDYAIADIVPLIGLHSTAYFYRVFQRSFGTTPLKYRREARTLAARA